MTAPMVSCVVPIYNGERFVADAVETILGQTHRPLEIVLVDDGSRDGSPELAARLAAERASEEARVRAVRQANAGSAAARNRGIREATGAYLAFLDVDDLWLPEKLARQLEVVAGGEADLSFTRLQNVWLDEVAAEADRYRETALARPMAGYLTQTMLAKRELFDRIGPFREDLRHANDTEWVARAKAAGIRVHVLDEVLVHRRLHRDNMSRSAAEKTDEYLALARALVARGRAPKK